MRVAWFTPWPPQQSGIAGRSVDLTTALATRGHGIDVFVDHRGRAIPLSPDGPAAVGEVRVQSAHDFQWRHARGQFDVVVYQTGNSRVHDFLWPYLFRYPGLTILHDARLHHARARTLLAPDGQTAYRQEFAVSAPAVNRDAAELAVAGFDGSYYYLWPLTRAIVTASRMVAAHSRGAAATLSAEFSDHVVEYVPLGMGRATAIADATRARVRAEWGVANDVVTFGVFGGLSPEKRLEPILRAFARTHRLHPATCLVLAGTQSRAVDTHALAASLGISDSVQHLGVLDDDAFEEAVGSVDVSLNLRWPTSLETSGPWVQALAAGRPTILMELAHQAHIPALDPQTWRRRPSDSDRAPIAISIDILDEEHSLGLAMARLAADEELRTSLGRSARRYWEAEHSVELMVERCEATLVRAAGLPTPKTSLPEALRPDVWSPTRTWLEPFGDLECALP